jgi:hypothetical protein
MLDFLMYHSFDSFDSKKPAQAPAAFIRILHAAPLCKKIDLYADGYLLARNLNYKKFTQYLKVPSGQLLNIKVYFSGTTSNPITGTEITLKPNLIYTIAFSGKSPYLEIYPVQDTKAEMTRNSSNIRFVNLSHDSPSMNITLSDGTVLFHNMNFRNVSGYKQFDPKVYTFYVREVKQNSKILTISNIDIKPEQNYTIYITGMSEGKPGLQSLMLIDGSTYIMNGDVPSV